MDNYDWVVLTLWTVVAVLAVIVLTLQWGAMGR
jgi:hypothetical protein